MAQGSTELRNSCWPVGNLPVTFRSHHRPRAIFPQRVIVRSAPLLLLVVAGIIGWVGATLILDAVLRRQRRPDLVERLLPYQPTPLGDTLGDEARDWLNRQA